MATFKDFQELDIRVGQIVDAQPFHEARNPAYKLRVDFGEVIGIKKSSAQVTECYSCNELIGKQVLGVINFPPRQVANFMSEVLVLGIYGDEGVVLIRPDKKVQNGDKIG